jgi:hypothetical protein
MMNIPSSRISKLILHKIKKWVRLYSGLRKLAFTTITSYFNNNSMLAHLQMRWWDTNVLQPSYFFFIHVNSLCNMRNMKASFWIHFFQKSFQHILIYFKRVGEDVKECCNSKGIVIFKKNWINVTIWLVIPIVIGFFPN